jgi:hypothetical protein
MVQNSIPYHHSNHIKEMREGLWGSGYADLIVCPGLWIMRFPRRLPRDKGPYLSSSAVQVKKQQIRNVHANVSPPDQSVSANQITVNVAFQNLNWVAEFEFDPPQNHCS